MIPPEDNTMELENCQESRTKRKEEEEKMPHFLLRGELNSFPLRSCLSRWSHFLQLGGFLSWRAKEGRWWWSQTTTTTTTTTSGESPLKTLTCQLRLQLFKSDQRSTPSLPWKKREKRSHGLELCWQFFSTNGKRETQSRGNANVAACSKQGFAVMTTGAPGDKRGPRSAKHQQ